ncbi:MAG TPA: hypothetical protein VH105_18925 [Burkholderiales bacterium]|jgi:hypothetical protein|nr:hypothetical protein [Burkholderiales bacterium]
MPLDTTQDKPARHEAARHEPAKSGPANSELVSGRVVDHAVRYAASSFVSQMSLVTAFVPGLIACVVVPAFPLRYAAHPALAALIVQCQPLFVVASVALVATWWLLKRQERDAGLSVWGQLTALWAVEVVLVLLQIWGVYPGAG